MKAATQSHAPNSTAANSTCTNLTARIASIIAVQQTIRLSGTKQHGMHDTARPECKQTGDDQSAAVKRNHRIAMTGGIVAVRPPHRNRQRGEGEDRQQMDRAPKYA